MDGLPDVKDEPLEDIFSPQPVSEKPRTKKPYRKRKKALFARPLTDSEDDEPLFSKKKKARPPPKSKLEKIVKQDPDDFVEVQCYMCGFNALSWSEMEAHQIESHEKFIKKMSGEKRDYQCHKCFHMFASEDKLRFHICSLLEKKLKTNNKDKKCDHCGEEFVDYVVLNEHIAVVHTKEKRFACDQCPFRTKRPACLQQHIKRMHEKEKHHVCEDCGKTFYTKFEIESHMGSAHQKGSFSVVCDLCGESFTSKLTFSVHRNQVHRKFWLCFICEKIFFVAKKLKNHYFNDHSIKVKDPKSKLCFDCHKEFKTTAEIDEHIRNCHSSPEEGITCTKCDQEFSYKVILKSHLIEVHDYNPIRDKNSREAREVFNVIQNSKVGGQKKDHPYTCPECGKGYSHALSLSGHVKHAHSKNRIKCESCDFTAGTQTVMNRHFRSVHDRSKCYQCELCPYKTYYLGHLKTHLRRTHAPEDAFPCPNADCSKAFKLKRYLLQHLVVEHNTVVD